ncbi:DUF2793 domain-containing protein [Fretibacter rubidus]|uniref:DUF2793 domain-containing protein n=1 Tax=Fretibacter rubidus TaxID=570162 RepID=UPI00352A224E
MDNTVKLSLPYIAPGQAQKHVTVNESLRRLDVLVQAHVIDWDVVTPPSSPQNGDHYVVGNAPTGSWADHANAIAAYADEGWFFYPPQKGWCVWLCSQNHHIAFDGTSWITDTGSDLSEPPQQLGINTTADSDNRLSVKSSAVLFSYDDDGTGSVYVKANKSGASQTASHLFQSGWAGHAEMGLIGDNDFRIKTCSDGTVWKDAIHIDGTTGTVSTPHTPDAPLDIALIGAAANGPAFAMRGTALSGSSDQNDGVGFYLNHNTPNNRQFGLMTTDTQTGVRIIALSSSPILEGVKNGSRADLVIGSGTHGAHVGFTLSNTQFSVSNWGGAATKTVFEVNGSTSQSGDLLSIGTVPASRGDAFRVGADKTAIFGGAARLAVYTKALLPAAGAGRIIFVSDAAGGPVPAFSDGTDWRRISDNSIID